MKPKTISRESHIAARQHPKEREYWFKRLSSAPLMNHFPYNRKKTDIDKRKTGYIEFTLPADLFVQLLKLSKGSDYSLNIILLASVIVLLGKYTGEKDVVVGVPIYKQEFKGNFINTVLPIRNQSHPRMIFKELLLKVGQGITEATENQYYPMEVLLEELNLNDASPGDGFPLFDAAVLLENIHNKHDIQHTLPNIMFSFLRTEETISGKVMFNRTRYEKDFIKKIIAHLGNLFHQVLYNVDIALGDIDILSDPEKKRLLWVFNDTRCEYPADKTLHELFAGQAVKTPDNIALVGRSAERKAPCAMRCAITYRELNRKSDQLAYVLKEKGVKPDSIVGIMVERSIEMIIGLLGVLKV